MAEKRKYTLQELRASWTPEKRAADGPKGLPCHSPGGLAGLPFQARHVQPSDCPRKKGVDK